VNAAGHRTAEATERHELLIALGDAIMVSPLPAGGAVLDATVGLEGRGARLREGLLLHAGSIAGGRGGC
jgi:hypothetical protein